MNTRIVTSLIVPALLSLAAGLVPLQAAQAEKPARIEIRKQVDDERKEPAERGREARPDRNGAAPAAPPRPVQARQDERAGRELRGGPAPQAPAQGVRAQSRRDAWSPGAQRYADRGEPPRGDRGRDDRRREDRDDRDDRRQDRTPSTYQPAWRDDGGSRHRYDDSRHRYDDSRHRYDDSRHRYAYARYDHHRSHTYHHYPARRYYYPPRGYVAPILPRNVVVVRHRHYNYWYGGGVWYRPYGARYVVVAPPLGVFVSVLPSFYSTLWFGGVPYYYANDTYYLWREPQRAYEVVAPPQGAATAAADPVAEDIFVYPREGQDEEQLAFDRYECHRWASDETGFDPTQPWGGVSEDRAGALRDAYLRAMTACLEGRGYTVR